MVPNASAVGGIDLAQTKGRTQFGCCPKTAAGPSGRRIMFGWLQARYLPLHTVTYRHPPAVASCFSGCSHATPRPCHHVATSRSYQRRHVATTLADATPPRCHALSILFGCSPSRTVTYCDLL